MAKLGYSPVIILSMLSFFAFAVEDGGQRNPEDQGREPLFSEMLRRMFSGSPTSPSSARYCEKLGTFMDEARAFFFPPNIDFRRGAEAEANTGNGSGEKVKVKEAVTKSLGKSKAAMEDSAKAAAEIVTETVKKTKEKVRNSLSEREGKPQPDL